MRQRAAGAREAVARDREGLVPHRKKVYTTSRMRCYRIVAGTLFSVVSAFNQQPGPRAEPKNVVPKEALDGMFLRAFQAPRFPPLTSSPRVFRAVTQPKVTLLRDNPGVCAIPLLEG